MQRGQRPHAPDCIGLVVRFLNDVVNELTVAGYMGELSEKKGHYVLLKAPSAITVQGIIGAVIDSGVRPAALGLVDVDRGVSDVVRRIASGLDNTLKDLTVANLLEKKAA